jgi:putative photosynthetic complex assembly protein 2
MDYLLPPLAAVLAWWFGTGVVMFLDGLPRATFRLTLAFATLLAAGALVCIARGAGHLSNEAAYAGFVCAVVVWGWHELTFLTGWLTGPRRGECSNPSHAPTRLREAVLAILWHELAIIGSLVFIAWLTWEAPNRIALATFALLWVMRLSAKFNLFLGVRNLGEQFLPPHLTYLPSYFQRRPMNALLPLVLVAATAVVVVLVHGAAGLQGGPRTANLLLASMLALAVAEHLLMVLPWQGTALWRWAKQRQQMAAQAAQAARAAEAAAAGTR